VLEPEGAQVAMLAGRVATLCAKPQERAALAQRVAQAVELEQALIEGTAVKQPAIAAASDELAQHLRALLSDVICGHLEPDLPALADELLLAGIDAQDAEVSEPEPAADGPDAAEADLAEQPSAVEAADKPQAAEQVPAAETAAATPETAAATPATAAAAPETAAAAPETDATAPETAAAAPETDATAPGDAPGAGEHDDAEESERLATQSR
jgi:hypothetical protein